VMDTLCWHSPLAEPMVDGGSLDGTPMNGARTSIRLRRPGPWGSARRYRTLGDRVTAHERLSSFVRAGSRAGECAWLIARTSAQRRAAARLPSPGQWPD